MQVKDLLSPRLELTTQLLWLGWFLSVFAYYGLVLLTPHIFGTSDDKLNTKALAPANFWCEPKGVAGVCCLTAYIHW